MQLDHIKKPTPENPTPSTTLLKEAIQSVDGLSKSVREFPSTWHKENDLNQTACGVSAAFGLVVGLLVAAIAKKGK